ncbi:MAG: hypothetical protein K6F28_07465 [Lachnospiraceae bacterium]|nr:hypothetical protein [Lachnospiraceae bacterium]
MDELILSIGDKKITVEWEDNESVDALKDLAGSGMNINMSMYGGFEQVGSIGTSLPRNDSQMTTSPGDIVLYSGNQKKMDLKKHCHNYSPLRIYIQETIPIPREVRKMAMNKISEKELDKVNGGYIFCVTGDPKDNLYEVRNDFDGSYVNTGSTYWTREGAIEAAKRAGMSTEAINIKQLHFLMVFHRLPKD